ncbi:adenosylcobinamide-GDP ribazoletransferase [Deinococcus radiopugnans]|uniref:Adenosylcobinamide-GDP ribazoletransferase n=1 Tax=Deinococcus radiopugnans ATCC 19172 TaxID=585398 RepID=A0A5C4XZE7_9DEIO|nr:adenosylcobinamide-GDP ribazoletransferase [Deinococcus radiopugnans]MBB6018205.1 adenosylcobinamide-GDP ribazoletransferase [Deinococcus radiopugnans ATCC 19172]TNM68172.1 adenosylcobinamide-GDP ribazoletransferase [Deinococcus radiopugnans ATCC 19172]
MRRWEKSPQLRAGHLALTFLTTLPLPHIHEVRDGDFARASAYYPLAGYAVGGLVSLLLWLGLPLPGGVVAALAVGAWLGLTGMLHFDGLVDSADALFAVKTPAQRLEILRDVHVGAFGLAAGVLALLTLWSVLAAPIAWYAPLVAAVAARTLLLLPMNLYPAARPESLGARSREGRVGLALVLAAPTLLLPGAWLAWLAALAAGLGVASFSARRLGGGLSGDIYGMIVVTAELAALGAYAWGTG